MLSTERFGKTVDDYERNRPSYPAALVDWIVATCGTRAGARVVDLGAGTGIAARLFAERDFEVTGIEPNAAMRACAERAGGVRYVSTRAEATELPTESANLVIAGQAFHWFALEPTLREIGRLLERGGAACAFWNVRAKTPFLAAYDATILRHVARYDERPQAEPTILAIAAAPGVHVLGRTELASVQRLDRAGLLGRAHSSSYVAHDAPDQAALDAELGELFTHHAQGGCVDFAYRTLAIAWQPRMK